jgi:hypothetical protein
MKTAARLLLPVALLLLSAGAIARAQIERLDLPAMVARTDNAVHAKIVGHKVFRVDDPVDGPELYFTTLQLQGRSLRDGTNVQVEVTFPGGFINEKEGVHNSEAPSADDIKIGNEVVAFYRWSNNMGGQVKGNALYASHGGLYRTVSGPKGAVVLGRGEGYAVRHNLNVSELETAIRSIDAERKKLGTK